MRTTLGIDDDVLQTAKEKRSAGAVISDLARRGFHSNPVPETRQPKVRNGVPLLPSRGETVTLSHVREILEEEGI